MKYNIHKISVHKLTVLLNKADCYEVKKNTLIIRKWRKSKIQRVDKIKKTTK